MDHRLFRLPAAHELIASRLEVWRLPGVVRRKAQIELQAEVDLGLLWNQGQVRGHRHLVIGSTSSRSDLGGDGWTCAACLASGS